MSNKYFSGFSLCDEEELFNDYSIKNDFTVSGFSLGAQYAFEYALNTSNRVDLLQLYSPAFFQDKDKKYKRLQLMFFKKDALKYCNTFLTNIASPSKQNLDKYFMQGTVEELDSLLNYDWVEEKLLALTKKGTKIEVFLGSDDKIVNTQKSKKFFKKYATVYYFKNAGHILKNDETND